MSCAQVKKRRAVFCCAFVFAAFTACDRPDLVPKIERTATEPPWFEDVTTTSGVHFQHDVGPVGSYFMPENLGSGLAVFDYDNDGRLDLYFVQNAGAQSTSRNQLYHQEPDGRFIDVSGGSGLDVAGRGMGVAVGDVNNDGWPDVLVTEYATVRLFLNDGGKKFREVTSDCGLVNPLWAISACFLDYDRDGWLDLVVGNYLAYDPNRPCLNEAAEPDYCGPKSFPGTVTKLFHNRGAQQDGIARFEDVTISSGLGALSGPALGVVCADFNGDRWIDLFVANDSAPNRLWINLQNHTFKDEAITRGVAFNALGQAQGNMGIAIADVNGDLAFDFFVTHLIEETHGLWMQGPRGLFQERTGASGLAQPRWHGTGFGTVLEDFNNDGAPDAAIVNGGVRRNTLQQPDAKTIAAVGPFWAPYAERNQLFENDGHGLFRDISTDNEPFSGTARVSRGLAWADLDNDGGVDLVVSSIANPARVFRNVVPGRGNWLLVRAIDPALGGRDAYGAEITIEAGGRSWRRWCNPGSSYASSNEPRAHFGLGSTASLDAIEVLWPDGTAERFTGGDANRMVVLRKGEGTVKAQ